MNFSNSRRLKVNPPWLSSFTEKVMRDVIVREDRCVVWTGGLDGAGYGSFWVPELGRSMGAHVVAWYLVTGEWPVAGEQVCHKCDRRICVRFNHLFLGTQQDNLADMRAKGRGVDPPTRYGEEHHSARMTDEQVAEMRAEFSGQRGQKAAFARRYGISKTAVTNILAGSVR